MINSKEFAESLRENKKTDKDGNIICSPELWKLITDIIEKSEIDIVTCCTIQ